MTVKLGRVGVILAVVALAAFAIGFYGNSKTGYKIEKNIAGVPIKSQIPLENVAEWKDLRFFDSKDAGVISCNLELAAINPATVNGMYSIVVDYGPQGIEIQEGKAIVRGNTPSELLQSCTVFACLLSGIDCPSNLFYARGITDGADALRIVIDENSSSTVIGAYSELMGALSFAQSKRADINQDRMVEDWETAANKFYIMPYVNGNGSCYLQPMTNLLQNKNGSNESVDCSLIGGIHIKDAAENRIEITNDDQIILSGDSEHLLVEAIILGNIISPEWINALHSIR